MASINASTSGAGGLISTADATGILNIQTAGTTAVTVNASQQVGVGTSSPGKTLHVYRNNTGQDAQIQIEQAGSGSPTLGFLETGVYAWLIGQYGADNSFRIAASGADLNTSPRLSIDTSGNLQFNSGYGSAATAYGCRAWVNFNGTGTVAIRASGNVSSITDRATGKYGINFTTAMPDANYAVSGVAGQYTSASEDDRDFCSQNYTTTSVNVNTSDSGDNDWIDVDVCCVAVFR
jgi:hypothetical protein